MLWITPFGHVLLNIQGLSSGVRLAQCLFPLGSTQAQNPVTHTQLDIAIRLQLKSGPPMGVLVVIVGMWCVRMEINKHGQGLYVVLVNSCFRFVRLKLKPKLTTNTKSVQFFLFTRSTVETRTYSPRLKNHVTNC